MSIRKFIKMYNIRKDDIDNKGNINPNAALYPMYMGQYIDNKTGKRFVDLPPEAIDDKLSDVDREYDNNSNAHPNRTVQIHLLGDKDPFQTVGPNLKRGYSALAFANKDKRHGDDYFSGWHKVDRAKDIHTVDYTPLDKIEENRQYAKRCSSADKDIASLGYTITPGEHYEGFYSLPLIIEADDSDVINYNDVIKDRYDPTRDYLPEVQLKRVIKKSVMPNMFIRKQDAKSAYGDKIGIFQRNMSFRLSAIEVYINKIGFIVSSVQDTDGLYAWLSSCFKMMLKDIHEVAADVQDMDDAFGDLADKDPAVDGVLANMDSLSDSAQELLSDVLEVSDRCAQHARDLSYLKETAKLTGMLADKFRGILGMLSDMASDLYDYLADMSYAGLTVSYVPDTDILEKATQKGGAFDWYDSSTYSDERLKNIYSGCRDVTLSDKQLKYIYDDFMKFKTDATQNNIIKGLSGLWQ